MRTMAVKGVMRMVRLGLMMGGVVLFLSGPVQAADELSLVVRERWHNWFAETDCVHHVVLSSASGFRGRVGWALTAGGRALLRGESAVDLGGGERTEVRIELTTPPVRAGVVLDCELTIEGYPEAGGPAVARTSWPVHIFPADPLAGEQAWRNGRTILLFDPTGETAGRLQGIGVTFELVSRPEGLAARADAILVVAEGLDWATYAGLAERFCQLAEAGMPILGLAPGAASVPLSRVEQGGEQLLVSRAAARVRELDVRLDAEAWPPDGTVALTGMGLTARRDSLLLTMGRDAGPWSWCEVRWPSGGRLVICGMPMMTGWDRTPAARYLFVRLVNDLTRKP